jgi:sialate O-acetylesterase
MKTFLALLAMFLTAATPLHAEPPDTNDFLLPSIFTSGMVLQRDREIPVWGWASPGEKITVTFAGKVARAVAGPDGRWEVALAAMPSNRKGRILTVKTASGAKRELDNVVVGDVWLLAGQSNMGIPVSETDGGADAAAQADYPWLRAFGQWPFQGASTQRAQDVVGGTWSVCSPFTAGSISAVGFYFARSLQPSVDVPIGLVGTAMGGTWIESWIDSET